MSIAVDVELDTSGLNCPMPILKTKLALNQMQSQQVLKVVSTDAGSWEDFAAFIGRSSHQLLSREQQDSLYIYFIRKDGRET
ncbi:TusA-related sulfurtransferase [Oceanospirillum multiglobuliferum]|uniref:UPF0033 domain-containing protein n=1 Tax=Oceanospirillum multiglobuliferum TaxID=64969 RepID=A0A1T4LI90_9GAMM|nr:sulfurtransferase TusA family protein [Oceanospirillum multiglobuliferum]OPX56647.1 hypothetical protein BTE48_01740 [Oceanospirillum multiglobuliferum]SJZ54489.1 TusA-related sulfurtransferase [Oceanospirillum multiglobuliferum]